MCVSKYVVYVRMHACRNECSLLLGSDYRTFVGDSAIEWASLGNLKVRLRRRYGFATNVLVLKPEDFCTRSENFKNITQCY